ncbi:hypothetical protein [Streptomyces sp. NBC_00425]|uniref:hypothetical protein n=1 Tax=Streptomyces sp. NBC_00425 TaxID=2975740 RepID=UPI002E1E00B5
MTTLEIPATSLTVSDDRSPVERAVMGSVLAGHEPEMYLGFCFYRPDGGARVWHSWTRGGDVLGDQVDQLALAAGMDSADWLHIGDRHCTTSHRGRIRIEAYRLRPVLADVQAGERSPEDRRAGIRRILDCAAEQTGTTIPAGVPRWVGFGPHLLTVLNPKGIR